MSLSMVSAKETIVRLFGSYQGSENTPLPTPTNEKGPPIGLRHHMQPLHRSKIEEQEEDGDQEVDEQSPTADLDDGR